ncbi:MAG TPA: hypothetical protein VHP13_01815, partial [Gammaproteobacteria bacterium]|nr:hypothetical protein [Gammaproteobacteria bacterium]
MFELASLPQDMGQIVVQGIALGRLAFRRLFMLTSIMGFLGLVPTAVLVWGAGDVEITNDFLFESIKGAYGFVGLLMVVLGMYVRAVLIKRVSLAARGQSEPREVELRSALRVWIWLMLAGIIYVAAVVVGMILLIVPGLILAVSLMFEEFGVVLEGMKPLQALNGSHNLVWGHWWRTLGLMLLIFIPLAILLAILSAMLGIDHGSLEAAALGRDFFSQTVLQMVFLAFFGPFIYSILFLY